MSKFTFQATALLLLGAALSVQAQAGASEAEGWSEQDHQGDGQLDQNSQNCVVDERYRIVKLNGTFGYQRMLAAAENSSTLERKALSEPAKLVPGEIVPKTALVALMVYFLAEKRGDFAAAVGVDLGVLERSKMDAVQLDAREVDRARIYQAPIVDKATLDRGTRENIDKVLSKYRETDNAVYAIEGNGAGQLETRHSLHYASNGSLGPKGDDIEAIRSEGSQPDLDANNDPEIVRDPRASSQNFLGCHILVRPKQARKDGFPQATP